MEQIKRQVDKARRRMILQQFLAAAPWWLCAALVVAGIGLAIPKIWFLQRDPTAWTVGWIVGGVVSGGLLALLWTLVRRRGTMDAAIELDHRFGLKERISSALAMSPEDRETEAGRALLGDASRRIEQITVAERFNINAGRPVLLPLVPAILIFLLVTFVGDAKREGLEAASDSAALRDRLKKSSEALKKGLDKRRRSEKYKGLEEADVMFKKLQEGLDELARDGKVDRQKVLIKMNDLAKEVEKRRKALGDSEKMKQQFSGLRKIERGPAEKVANALKKGDFPRAMEELRKLSERIKGETLSEEEQRQLAKQLKQMRQKMRDMVDAQRQAKRELQKQIDKKRAAGDLEAAGKLQRQLDQLERQDAQMNRLEQMAQKLGKAQEGMESGDSKQAAEQLEQLASDLSEMQEAMGELESLDEVMDAIASAKQMMQAENDGEMAPLGMSSLDQFSEMPGNGMGEGQGFGYRPEREQETGEYDARERAKPKQGEAVRVGDAFGPNRAGMTLEEVKQQILSSLDNDADPLTDQKLPRSQREHIIQYYKRLESRE